MENPLSPREIQTRIRRGESPQSVADSAGVTLDKISAYALPVMAEREHIAERARATIVRRKNVDGSPVQLGTALAETLMSEGRSLDDSVWDSWKRDDGRWAISFAPFDGAETVTYAYDVPGRYVVPDDDRARDLVGDRPSAFSAEMAIADAIAEHGLHEPAETRGPEPEHAAGVTSIKQARDRRAQEQLSLNESDGTVAAPTLDEPGSADAQHLGEPEHVDHDVAVNDSVGAPEQPRRKKPERRRVPSWDEIMFGNKSE